MNFSDRVSNFQFLFVRQGHESRSKINGVARSLFEQILSDNRSAYADRTIMVKLEELLTVFLLGAIDVFPLQEYTWILVNATP
jgi:hypothetical protein